MATCGSDRLPYQTSWQLPTGKWPGRSRVLQRLASERPDFALAACSGLASSDRASLEWPPYKAAMSLRFTCPLILSIVWLASSAWADFLAGAETAKNGDYATALRKWCR